MANKFRYMRLNLLLNVLNQWIICQYFLRICKRNCESPNDAGVFIRYPHLYIERKYVKLEDKIQKILKRCNIYFSPVNVWRRRWYQPWHIWSGLTILLVNIANKHIGNTGLTYGILTRPRRVHHSTSICTSLIIMDSF